MLKCPNGHENVKFVLKKPIEVDENRHIGQEGHYEIVSHPADQFFCLVCEEDAIEEEIDDENQTAVI